MIAFLRDEPGAQVVADALLDPNCECRAHALNSCEVYYDFHRAGGREEALQAIADLVQVGVVQDSAISSSVWSSRLFCPRNALNRKPSPRACRFGNAATSQNLKNFP